MVSALGYLPPNAQGYQTDPKRFWAKDAGMSVPRASVGSLSPQVLPPAGNSNGYPGDQLPFIVSAQAQIIENYKQEVFPIMAPEDLEQIINTKDVKAGTTGAIVSTGENDWRFSLIAKRTDYSDPDHNYEVGWNTMAYSVSAKVPLGDTYVNITKEDGKLNYNGMGYNGIITTSSGFLTVRTRPYDRLSVGGTVKCVQGSIYHLEYIGTAEVGYFTVGGIPFGFGAAFTQRNGKAIGGIDLDIVRIANLAVQIDGKETTTMFTFSIGFGG